MVKLRRSRLVQSASQCSPPARNHQIRRKIHDGHHLRILGSVDPCKSDKAYMLTRDLHQKIIYPIEKQIVNLTM